MSTYRKIKHVTKSSVMTDFADTYEWKPQLQAEEKNGFKHGFLPVSAFSLNLIKNFSSIVREGVVFEIAIPHFDRATEGIEVRWFAKVRKMCGYRVLARYIGSDEDFWVNILSKDVNYVGSASEKDPSQTKIVYGPPAALLEKHFHNLKEFLVNVVDNELKQSIALKKEYENSKKHIFDTKFEVNQRLELLNYNDSRQIRVARVQKICGRRLNVLVTKEDFDGVWSEGDEDRQIKYKKAEYWIDQDSFFIFPVGWATYNGFNLNAKSEYKKHAKAIAESIKNNETPNYGPKDVTPSFFNKPKINLEDFEKVKVGQKCELLDPLAQQFHVLRVASVLKIMSSEGYILVGMDGPDAEEDSVPLYIASPFLFPVGYAEKYGLKLIPPPSYEKGFKWDKYLKEKSAEPLPIDLFKTKPDVERLSSLKVGAKLEAADMCENQFICPAMIKGVHGRIINVNFEGWDEEFDELYDIESHDIFPTGWCEIHGYVLQKPVKPKQ